MDHVIGHWTVSGLLTLSSGTWIRLRMATVILPTPMDSKNRMLFPARRQPANRVLQERFSIHARLRTLRWDRLGT